MCREVITIAICAPQSAPALSFACGKLHLVAGQRLVCKDAKGSCVCYFGTCGIVERDVLSASSSDLSEVNKVRCIQCTIREDNINDRRPALQVLDSPLLQRAPIPKNNIQQHMVMLSKLWGNKPTCPFHIVPLPTTTSTGEKNEGTIDSKLDDSNETSTSIPDVSIEEHVETAPTSPNDSAINTEEPTASASGKIESTYATTNMIQQENSNPLQPVAGLGSSRWAPDNSAVKPSPGPNRAPYVNKEVPKLTAKTVDTTKKFAGAKAFLSASRLP
ncbi:hypothetical protein G7046_g5741 [Stylonectria norvegica]|nr:hypothetical protein G7046_g5741 [Stylonectria norvegica]